MKRILAFTLACVLLVACSVTVLATDGESEGSMSPTAKELQKEIEDLKELVKAQKEALDKQTNQIADLANAVRASSSNKNVVQTQSGGSSGSSGGGGGIDPYTQSLIRNNAVTYGSNLISQGGHVEINGGKSNITFLIGVPDTGTSSSAVSLANGLGGSLLNVVTVKSPVAFRTAKVNFYLRGVTNGDNIAVYQVQGGKWVQLQTAEIRTDHVVVNMSQTGAVAFVRVPVLATAIN